MQRQPWNHGIELKLTPSQQLRQKKYRQNNWFDWYGRLSWINNINKNKESFWSWNVVLEIDYYHFQMILQLWGWTSLFAVSQRLMTWKWWVAEILSLKYSLLLKMEFMYHPQFWLGWKSETQAMSRSKMDKNRQENEFGLAHIGESSFCSFLNNFKRPSWLAAFSVLKSETQSISRSRMGKNRRDCRKRKNGFGLPHIFESYFCFSF